MIYRSILKTLAYIPPVIACKIKHRKSNQFIKVTVKGLSETIAVQSNFLVTKSMLPNGHGSK